MDTIVITGANRGIGLELTKRFLEAGESVVATCRDLQALGGLEKLADSLHLKIQSLEVRDAESVSRLCSVLADQVVDVLINCAGITGGDHQSIDDMDYSAWIDAFEVNTLAPFRLATALRNNLKRSARPRIVTLSSQMGSLHRKSRGSFAYRTSKAAVNKAMQVMALEFESDGIIVCPVHPGWVRTDMGGPQADISVEQSASGLFDFITLMSMEHSGRFWTWEGLEHPW